MAFAIKKETSIKCVKVARWRCHQNNNKQLSFRVRRISPELVRNRTKWCPKTGAFRIEFWLSFALIFIIRKLKFQTSEYRLERSAVMRASRALGVCVLVCVWFASGGVAYLNWLKTNEKIENKTRWSAKVDAEMCKNISISSVGNGIWRTPSAPHRGIALISKKWSVVSRIVNCCLNRGNEISGACARRVRTNARFKVDAMLESINIIGRKGGSEAAAAAQICKIRFANVRFRLRFLVGR